MRCDYSDITDQLGPPLWWDEAGVPRYKEFIPGHQCMLAARQVVLMEIACQECGSRFQVVVSSKENKLDEMIKEEQLEYGDPPAAGCCEMGSTMRSVPLRVIQFWQKNGEWKRNKISEGPLACSWMRHADDGSIIFGGKWD